MRILLNQLTALRQRSGIGHYTAELARCLAGQAGSDELQLYPGAWEERGLQSWQNWRRPKKAVPKGDSAAPAPPSSLRSKGKLGNLLLGLGRRLADWHFRLLWSWRDFDLYHEPNGIPLPCAKPTVVTVCDLSVLLHPEWHPRDRVAYYEKHFAAGLSRAAHVLAISEFSRQEILQTFDLPPDRVTCTHLGIRGGWRPMTPVEVAPALQRLNLEPGYFLHVGTLEPRKNLATLIRAYVRLPESLREMHPLVLVGGWGWNVGELADLIQGEGRAHGVRHLGYVPDADLPAIYNGAHALVFPTLYEGFGLPPLEMLGCGGAVLASSAGAVAEVVGGQAHLVDPRDEVGWHDALRRLCSEEDWRENLRRGSIDHARHFTWERCAEQTWQVYRSVLPNSRSRAA